MVVPLLYFQVRKCGELLPFERLFVRCHNAGTISSLGQPQVDKGPYPEDSMHALLLKPRNTKPGEWTRFFTSNIFFSLVLTLN